MRSKLAPTRPLLLGTLLVASVSAQSRIQAEEVTGPVKNAGVYHAATGTWTRANTQSAVGPDVLYNNTGAISYFTTMPDTTLGQFEFTDAGRLPSISDTGDDNLYSIDGLYFAYCSSSGLGQALQFNYSFDEAGIAPCGGAGIGASGAFSITGLPSSATVGTQGCWLITIDLMGTTDDFTMVADQEGIYDSSDPIDDFAYTFSIQGHGADATTGPILFGDPVLSPRGDGTTNFGYGAGPDGTGLGQNDLFWIQSALVSGGPGCYWFGSYPVAPWAGFYLRLSGDGGDTTGDCGCTPFCTPGGANSISAGGAVLSSAGGYGSAGATFDLVNVPTQPGLIYSGANQIQLPFGCGDRCAAGNNVRGIPFTPASTSVSGVGFDMSGPNTVVQYWYRDPLNFAACGSAFNLSNAIGL